MVRMMALEVRSALGFQLELDSPRRLVLELDVWWETLLEISWEGER
jgi:hypothetical protein